MATTPEEICENLKKIRALTLDDLHCVTNKPEKRDWDDDIFFKKYGNPGQAMKIKRASLSDGFQCALSYMSWYMGIAIPTDEEDFKNAFLVVWSLMKTSTGYIFKEGDKSVRSVGAPGSLQVSTYSFAGSPTGGLKKPRGGVYTIREAKEFGRVLHDLRDSTDSEICQKIINVVGLLMLKMMKLGPKSDLEVAKNIVQRFDLNMKKLFENTYSWETPPPHSKYVDQHKKYLGEYSSLCQLMRGLLVAEYVKADASYTKEVLDSGCLLTLWGNGLGLVTWVKKAADKLGVDVDTYLDQVMVSHQIFRQGRRYRKFAENHEKLQTWPFCRLFEQGALINLNTSNNPDLCILSALVVLEDASKVEGMLRFKSCKDSVSQFVLIASVAKEVIGKGNDLSSK